MKALLLLALVACGRDRFDPAHNVAFVTSTVHDPLTFGRDGAGADAICQQTATNASLAGEYRAFVATTSVSATDHLGNSRGWIRTDGKPFIDAITDLAAAHELYPLRLDENGNDVGPAAIAVATGADLNGRVSQGGNCNDWTNVAANYSYGTPIVVGAYWSAIEPNPCTVQAHLYCFGVGLDAPLAVEPAAGRLAFVSVQSFVPTGGLAGADALCQGEASAAGLSGTFSALLPTSSASAMSRFDLSGATWVRVDGVELADSPLAFANGDLLAAPNITALGTPTKVNAVMTGGTLTTPTLATCGDWAGGMGTAEGDCTYATPGAFATTSIPCAGTPIYCLEQ